ncbi:uncharacterized protein I303_100209 [Kwoniella dejecticola CBS 10117]|uniref:Uncharacterized protein n=1 Tax=Kwoniella dejecticola CBS 10117 TaxID=1296121 RepID=A0AAJ8KHC9_9TREE
MLESYEAQRANSREPLTATRSLYNSAVTGQQGKIIFTGSAVAEVASTKHLDPACPLKALNDEKAFVSADRYNESKLVLHSLVRPLIAHLPNIIITDVNPGFVYTPLYSGGGSAAIAAKRIGRKPEEGARNVSFALITLEQSTDWYTDCKPCRLHAPWLHSREGVTFSETLWAELLEVVVGFSPDL